MGRIVLLLSCIEKAYLDCTLHELDDGQARVTIIDLPYCARASGLSVRECVYPFLVLISDLVRTPAITSESLRNPPRGSYMPPMRHSSCSDLVLMIAFTGQEAFPVLLARRDGGCDSRSESVLDGGVALQQERCRDPLHPDVNRGVSLCCLQVVIICESYGLFRTVS